MSKENDTMLTQVPYRFITFAALYNRWTLMLYWFLLSKLRKSIKSNDMTSGILEKKIIY